MSDAVAVHIDNLWKRFGYRRALVGVSLDITTASSLAIYGPNGAGKSTLLKILATLSRASSGRTTVFGHDLSSEVLEVRRHIGVVFHDHCLRNDLTLDENLRFYAGLYGVKFPTARTDMLIERLGLESRRREPVRIFSQGMLKRATLIRSLLHDPRLWLLDEPFAALDPDGRVLLEKLIAEELEQGRTVVFVTHDIERGLRVSGDSIMLKDGEMVARGHEAVREGMT